MAVTGSFAGAFSMGRIERAAGCYIGTRFWVYNGVPLRALDSFIDQNAINAGPPIPIPLHDRSRAAGFLRVWVTIFAALAVFALALHPIALVAAVPLSALSVYLWIFFGRLSPSEVRRRLAYATWVGLPFDPAYLAPDTEPPGAAALRELVDERTAQAPTGYRAQHAQPWRAVAVDSEDPELLVAALTRARLERRGADPAERAELDALHAALWARLDPMLAAGKAPRAFLDWQAFATRDGGGTSRTDPRLVVAGTLAAVVGIAIVTAGKLNDARLAARPTLAIVNATGADGLTVLLDGAPVATRLPSATEEGDRAFVLTVIERGAHELVALDASGAEIDRRRVEASVAAFLYVPARAGEICFFRERVTYARVEGSVQDHDASDLDPAAPLYTFGQPVSHWFGPAPATVGTGNRSATVEWRTVRAKRCSAKGAP